MAINLRSKSNRSVALRCINRVPRKGGRYAGEFSWAAQTGFHFRDNVMMINETPIAMAYHDVKLVLVAHTRWPGTGNIFNSLALAASHSGYDKLHVPDFHLGRDTSHATNLAHLYSRYDHYRKRLELRADMDWKTNDYRQGWMRHAWKQMEMYAERFKQKVAMPDVEKHVEMAHEAHKRAIARYNSPKQVAQREYRTAKKNLKELVGPELFEGCNES